jgi:hypothetical protein
MSIVILLGWQFQCFFHVFLICKIDDWLDGCHIISVSFVVAAKSDNFTQFLIIVMSIR